MWSRTTSIILVGFGIAISQPVPKVPPAYGQTALEQPTYPYLDTVTNHNGAVIPPYYSAPPPSASPYSSSAPTNAALSYTVGALAQQNTALSAQVTQLSKQMQKSAGNLQAIQADWEIEKQKLNSLIERLQAERLAFQENQQVYLDNPRSKKVLKAMLKAGLANLRASGDYKNDDHVPLRVPSAPNPSIDRFQNQDINLADF